LTLPFLVAVLLSAAVFYLGLDRYYAADVLYQYRHSTQFGIFIPLSVVVAVLPVGIILNQERKNNVFMYGAHRSTMVRYMVSKAVVCATVGGLALSLGAACICLGLLADRPLNSGAYQFAFAVMEAPITSFDDLIIMGHPVFFFSVKLFLLFLHGASCALVAFAVAHFCSDLYIVQLFPFILYQAVYTFLGPYINPMYHPIDLMIGIFYAPFDSWLASLGYALVYQLSIWAAAFFVATRGMERRRCHA
jgi:hypothetical protein